MNERIKQLAEQAGYFLYDLTETHERKTVETDSKDEWITLERFAELVRQDEREACAKLLDDWGKVNWNIWDCVKAIRARGDMSTKPQNVDTSAEYVHENDKSIHKE